MSLVARLTIGCLGLSLVWGLAGCSAPNEALSHPTPPASNDAMIKQIESEPGMPPDVKAQAIARLKSSPPVPKMYAH